MQMRENRRETCFEMWDQRCTHLPYMWHQKSFSGDTRNRSRVTPECCLLVAPEIVLGWHQKWFFCCPFVIFRCFLLLFVKNSNFIDFSSLFSRKTQIPNQGSVYNYPHELCGQYYDRTRFGIWLSVPPWLIFDGFFERVSVWKCSK